MNEAVDVVRGLAAGAGLIFQHGLARARHQQGQVGGIASVQWQIDDLAGGNHLAAVARIGFEKCCSIGDGHGLVHLADLKRKIHALPGADGDLKWSGHFRAKSGLRDHDDVVARQHARELILAVGVRCALHRRALVDILQYHMGAGHDGSACVFDHPKHGAAVILRGGRTGDDKQKGRQVRPRTSKPRHRHGSAFVPWRMRTRMAA